MKKWQPVDWFLIVLCSILFIELCSYFFSIYRPNSFYSLEKIFLWVCYCITLRWALTKLILHEAMHLVYYLLCGIATVLALGTILSFTAFRSELHAFGWLNVSAMKGLFSPLGLKLNDWATVGICVLPFPLIFSVLIRKNTLLFFSGLLFFVLILYSVLITFSRGAYLSLLVFVLLFLGLIIYFGILSWKIFIRAALPCFIIFVLICIPVSSSIFDTFAMNKTISQQRSTMGRMEILKSGWCKFKTHPWQGRGGYNFALGENECIQQKEDSGDSVFANNLYLQIAVEKGLPGLIVYGLIFFLSLVTLFKRISTSISKEQQLIAILLFSGLFSFCFRELFFGGFFENNLILILVGFYSSMSSALNNSLEKISVMWMNCLGIPLLIMVAGFLIFQSLANKKPGRDLEGDFLYNPKRTSMLQLNIRDLVSGQLRKDMLAIKKEMLELENEIRFFPDPSNAYFNLACLNFISDTSAVQKANDFFQKAIQSAPYNSEFLIGYGICASLWGDTSLANQLYEKAIRVDPEIADSEFFQELSVRHPASKAIISKCIDSLSISVNRSGSPILKARLAKLKLYAGEHTQAKKLFLEVINQMPDLNRPYYYLGQIAAHEGDTAGSLDLYKKSLFLNNTDYFSHMALFEYYQMHPIHSGERQKSARRYLESGRSLYLNKTSQYTIKTKAIYRTAEGPKNELIFVDLPVYIRTRIDFNKHQ